MPIKGLQHSARAPLPRLGKLHKGGPRSGSGLGEDLKYFRFSAEGGDAGVEAAFREAYGPEPSMLRVYLPYADLDSNLACWKEHWGAGGRLLHRCDGETCVKWLGEDGRYIVDPQMMQHRPCPCLDQPRAANRCREVGRLQVILPELWEAGYVGVVTLETHSVHDIVHIDSVLRHTLERSANPQAGLLGIEFVLRRQAERIRRPSTASGSAMTTKWLVHIEPTSEWLLAQLEQARQAQLGRRFRAEGQDGATQGEPPTDEEAAPEGAVTSASTASDAPAGLASSQADTLPAAAVASAAWVRDRARVSELVALARAQRLDRNALLTALGVQRLGEITYSFDEAGERVRRMGSLANHRDDAAVA